MIVKNTTNDWKSIYHAEQPIAKVYVGTHYVWPNGNKAYLMDVSHNSYYIKYDGNSTLTQADVTGTSLPLSGILYATILSFTKQIGTSAFMRAENMRQVTFEGAQVTTIGPAAFMMCTSLSSITLPNTITSIGSSAFDQCSGITSFTFPASVESVGQAAFRWSGLKTLTIPSGVTLGDQLLYGCRSLSSITINEGVTAISNEMLRDCTALTSVTFPSSTTSIGWRALQYSTGLEWIKCEAVVPPSIGVLAFDSTRSCPILVPCESLDAYKQAAGWSDYASRIEGYGCPKAYLHITDGTTKTVTGNGSTTLTLGEVTGLTSLMNISSVTITDEVTTIGSSCFSSARNLVDVDLPNTITAIGERAFNTCSAMTSIDLPSGLTTIGDYAFGNCSGLTSITFPASVTSLGQGTMFICPALESITCLATTPPTIGSTTFNRTNNCPIYVPCPSVRSYKQAAGWSDYSQRIQICSGVVATVDAGFFTEDCINLNDTTTVYIDTIQNEFNVAYRLGDTGTIIDESWLDVVGINFEPTVETINFNLPMGGFEYFPNLSGITFQSATPPTLSGTNLSDTFNGTYPIFVPCNSVEAYRQAPVFSGVSARITGVCNVNAFVFVEDTGKLYSIISSTYPTQLWRTDLRATVNNYTLISSAEVTTATTAIEWAFEDCISLTSVTIANTVTKIGENSFYNCSGLTSIVIPSGVTTIETNSFYNCKGLTSITIPSAVTYIGMNAFMNCTGLTSMTVQATTPPTLDDYALDNTTCTIYVPSSSLGSYLSDQGWSNYSSRIQGY